MKDLSLALLNAQRSSSRRPYLSAVITDIVPRYRNLYQGTEPEGPCAAAVSGGNLIRARIAPSEGGRLYYQTIPSPSPASPLGEWTYSGQTGVLALAATASGGEACIFWIKTSRAIYQMISTNSGLSWGSPQLIGYTASTSITGMASCYEGGAIYLFYCEQAYLRVMKHVTTWSAASSWDKATGNLSGVSALAHGWLKLAVAGLDGAGNSCLWTLEYDGAAWGELNEVMKAPPGSGVTMGAPSIGKSSNYILSFQLNGRIYLAEGVGSLALWEEPRPFPLTSAYGLALASEAFLASAATVWEKETPDPPIDVSGDILSLKERVTHLKGELKIELGNEDRRYTLHPPGIGSAVLLKHGYFTPQGPETGVEHIFFITGYEYYSAGGKASVTLFCADKWEHLSWWRARYALSWASGTKTVCEIVSFLLARAGIRLSYRSGSDGLNTLKPCFAVGPNASGVAALEHLLGKVPDRLVLEGDTAWTVYPLAQDGPVYGYGDGHGIIEGRYLTSEIEISHLVLEGDGRAEVFGWEGIARGPARYRYIRDTSLSTQEAAGSVALAVLREAEMGAVRAIIRVPVNAGQELFDVVSVSDKRIGLEENFRVSEIVTTFAPGDGRYEQTLILGRV